MALQSSDEIVKKLTDAAKAAKAVQDAAREASATISGQVVVSTPTSAPGQGSTSGKTLPSR